MVFLTFDDTLGDPPDITKLIPPQPQPQLVPYTPEPDPLADSPIENWASEMARQNTRMAQLVNGSIIALQDIYRQLRAHGKALEDAAQSAGGPAQALALTPAPSAVQARNSQAATADWTSLPVPSSTLTPEQQARFWRKVVRTPEHWVWRGAVDRVTGRGQIRIGKKLHYAHRVAYTLHTGNALDGENLKNICGLPLCVDPNHQRPGSIGAELRAPKQTQTQIDHDRMLEERAGRIYDDYLEQSQATEAVRNMDVTPYAKDRYGHKKLCRKGHFLTVQPSGRVTCRACDLDRKRRYEMRHTLVNQREQFVNTTRAELADGLDREFTDNLLAQILPADAPAPDPAPSPPPSSDVDEARIYPVVFPEDELYITHDVPYATNMPLVEREHEQPIKVTTNPDTGEEERWYPLEAPKTREFLPAIVEETADTAGYEEAYERTVTDKLSNLRMLRPTKNPDPES